MRGSPLIRTLIVVLGLAIIGMGLAKLGSEGPTPPPPAIEAPDDRAGSIAAPFVLTLSADARSVELESSGQVQTFEPDTRILAGTLPLEPGHPTVFITVKWSDPEPSPRFAKLVLEPAGLPSMNRVFDAQGNLSDVWEMHLHD
jgi:hypothetical protein